MKTAYCLAVLAGLLEAGCSCSEDTTPGKQSGAGGGKEIILYAGAGLRPAVVSLIEAFEEKTGVKVAANYDGSGRQLGQISAVRKGDLFMPGAEFYVDRAIENGLADKDTKRVVAYFVPVIFVQQGNPKNIQTVKSLARDGIRVGFGDERSCAVGKKSLLILEKNGVALRDMEKNIVYASGTVNELGLAIQMKTVDAVIIWDANARQFEEYGDAIPIPLEANAISTVPIVRLTLSRYPKEAQQFIDFVVSDDGRRVLQKHGYTISLSQE